MKRLLLFLLLLIVNIPALARADWCGLSEDEAWKEFGSLYYAATAGASARPVLYVLAAPWCPYCAQVFKALQAKQYSFDVRFIPSQPKDETHRRQIADLVLDGTVKSLIRAYLQKSAPKTQFNDQQLNFIVGVQNATDLALQHRFGRQAKNWGSPISFLMVQGSIQMVVGMPNLDAIDRLLSGTSGPVTEARTRALLAAGLPKDVPVTGTATATARNVRLRVLPDRTAFSAICAREGTSLKPVGLVSAGGEDWLVFNIPYAPDAPLRYFAPAADFSGWRR